MNIHFAILRTLTVTVSATMFLGVSAAEEKEVGIEQVPEAVRKTIDANRRGDTIEEIELEEEGGKQVYEVEFVAKGGEQRELEIAPNGSLLKEDLSPADQDDSDDDKGDASSSKNDDNDDDEQKIDPASAPAAVRSAIEPLLDGKKINAMTKESDDGKIVYEAEYLVDGLENSIEVSSDGKVLEIEKEMTIDKLPATVQKAVTGKMPGGVIRVAEQVERRDSESPVKYYEVKVQHGGKLHEVKVDPDGKVLEVEKDD